MCLIRCVVFVLFSVCTLSVCACTGIRVCRVRGQLAGSCCSLSSIVGSWNWPHVFRLGDSTFTHWVILRSPLGAGSQNTSTCNLWVNLSCVFIMMLKTLRDRYSRNRLSINADLSLTRHRNKENPAVWSFPVTWVRLLGDQCPCFCLLPLVAVADPTGLSFQGVHTESYPSSSSILPFFTFSFRIKNASNHLAPRQGHFPVF